MFDDTIYMKYALELAEKAKESDEVPVGAVIVKNGNIISEGYNLRETLHDATAHAEMIAIKKACEVIGDWRLLDCTLYVTLEPCPMCMGAIINSRIPKIIFGASDPNSGACKSVISMNSYPLNHKPIIENDVLGKECSNILSDYFKNKRTD